MARAIYVIAAEIKADWKKWRESYAADYLNAMSQLSSVADSYYFDSADSIIRYFLANANGWRGEKAREIKAELKKMVGL